MAEASANFYEQEDAGYHVVSSFDNDMMFYGMMQPGATGVGLHLSPFQQGDCCAGSFQKAYRTLLTESRELWYEPSIITWASPVNPETFEVYEEIKHCYKGQEIVGPHLMIIEPFIRVSDYGWYLKNAIIPEDEFLIDNPITVGDYEVYGLIPAWEVLPFYDGIKELIDEYDQVTLKHDLEISQFCDCTIDYEYVQVRTEGGGYDYFAGHMTPCDKTCNIKNCTGHAIACEYVYGHNLCSCGQEPTLVQRFIAFHDATPDVIGEFNYPYNKALEYLIEQFETGWETLQNLAIETGDNCYISYYRLHSPWPLSYGQKTQTNQPSNSSTNSETLQAS